MDMKTSWREREPPKVNLDELCTRVIQQIQLRWAPLSSARRACRSTSYGRLREATVLVNARPGHRAIRNHWKLLETTGYRRISPGTCAAAWIYGKAHAKKHGLSSARNNVQGWGWGGWRHQNMANMASCLFHLVPSAPHIPAPCTSGPDVPLASLHSTSRLLSLSIVFLSRVIFFSSIRRYTMLSTSQIFHFISHKSRIVIVLINID